jgi:hypothetical protein
MQRPSIQRTWQRLVRGTLCAECVVDSEDRGRTIASNRQTSASSGLLLMRNVIQTINMESL